MTVLAPQLLDGRYQLLEQIGTGGTCTVYRAHDETLGRDVAIKQFAQRVDDLSDEGRRRSEVRLLAGLSHPGVVTLFDAVLHGEPPYFVMEFVDGQSLRERLSRGALPPLEADQIGAAVAAGLAAIHARGVVHRDVKPENIVLPSAATSTPAKLVDFGIARPIEGALTSAMTAAGTVLGTAGYLSPEQARGEPVGSASDVYSLGLVLLEALTGEKPFPGTPLEAAAARLTRDPDLTSPALDGHRELLARMTARDPRDRPSAQEVSEILSGDARTRVLQLSTIPGGRSDEEATAASTAPLSAAAGSDSATGAVTRPITRRSRRGVLAALVVLLCLALAAGIVAGTAAILSGAADGSGIDLPGAAGIEKVKEPAGADAPVEPAPVDPAPVEPAPVDSGDSGSGGGGNGGPGNNGKGNGNGKKD